MGRPSNKTQRRTEITVSLMKLMSNMGYEKASIQSIAKHAGLSAGLVHYHFKNKQEILIELIDFIHQNAWRRYQELSEKAVSPQERLNAFIDAALAFGEGSDLSAVAAWVVIGSESIRQDDVRQSYQKAVQINLQELEKLLVSVNSESKATNSTLDTKALAAATYGAIEGAFLLATTAQSITPVNYAAETVKQMVFGVLGD